MIRFVFREVLARMVLPAGIALAGLCLAPDIRAEAKSPTSSEANRFGFAGKEIFPIDFQISQLHAADLDGDGLNDLIVVNNARSKINLLYNQTGKTNPAPTSVESGKRELNELPPGARFRIESIASEKRISSLVVADLNGDGRPDLAYFGEPKELVVQYNEGHEKWSTPKRWPLEDGLLNPNALVTGDLNGDGRADLLLLAEGFIYYLKQDANHLLAEPEKIPYSGSVQAVQVLDIQGDGRDDLLLVSWDSPSPFRFRLQNAEGQLGPEIHFEVPPIRSYLAEDLDGDHQAEVVTIAQRSGRAEVGHFIKEKGEPLVGDWRQGQLRLLPLKRTGHAKRGMAWADVNGDGKPDLLVAEPDSGQLTLYLQEAAGRLGAPQSYPTFTGVSDLAVADWDGNGHPEIFLLSSDERQVGVTHFDKKNGIGFPKSLLLDGRPLALASGQLHPDGPASLVLVVDQGGRREVQIRNAHGDVQRVKMSEDFKGNPSSVTIQDADQDGRPDILVVVPYEKIKVMRQLADGKFEEQDVTPPGGSAEDLWLSAADLDGDAKPELLFAQKNFVRAAVLKRAADESSGGKGAWAFEVKEQINGAASNSRIVGAAALPRGTNRLESVFLLDADRNALSLCERTGPGLWKVVRNVTLPAGDFRSVQALKLGDEKAPALGFLGLNAAAWMSLGGEVWSYQELDSYETPIRDGYLNDVVAGDLNQDGRKDLVFMEITKSYLDLVSYEPPHSLVPANRWQVFEERTFRSRRSEGAEPREALIADLTGDGKKDLVVLVHDRIILYPQE